MDPARQRKQKPPSFEGKLQTKDHQAAEQIRRDRWDSCESSQEECQQLGKQKKSEAFLRQMQDLDAQQTEKIAEWTDICSFGLAEHGWATQIYGALFFWISACPNMLLSALASVLVMYPRTANKDVNKDVTVALLVALSGVLTGVGAYWKWQGESEKHRSAQKEYNVLGQRLDLWATEREKWPDNLQHRQLLFSQTQLEIHGKILELKKEVPPVPGWIRKVAFSRVDAENVKTQRLHERFEARIEAERRKEMARTPRAASLGELDSGFSLPQVETPSLPARQVGFSLPQVETSLAPSSPWCPSLPLSPPDSGESVCEDFQSSNPRPTSRSRGKLTLPLSALQHSYSPVLLQRQGSRFEDKQSASKATGRSKSENPKRRAVSLGGKAEIATSGRKQELGAKSEFSGLEVV